MSTNKTSKPGQITSGVTKVTELGKDHYVVEHTELYKSGSDLDGGGIFEVFASWGNFLYAVGFLAVIYGMIRVLIWLIML